MASSYGDKLFLLGGFAGQEMDDIYVYDLKSKQWNYLGDVKLPVPRSVCISGSIQVRKIQSSVLFSSKKYGKAI